MTRSRSRSGYVVLCHALAALTPEERAMYVGYVDCGGRVWCLDCGPNDPDDVPFLTRDDLDDEEPECTDCGRHWVDGAGEWREELPVTLQAMKEATRGL